ncbi:MAG TPA: hypothetical protein VFN37_04695 [Candidatus Baltobacteraceae bacterium]|nr:hypothetical protein [Candidatus Baltobacteraceae bacterium]
MRVLRISSCCIGLFMLAACGGAGGGGSPLAPMPGGGGGGAPPPLPSSLTASSGAIVGADNAFSPSDGDASSGGNGQTVDGIPCVTTMDESHYHIHVFIGLIQNGRELALPDGAGMKNPGADSGGVTSTASCFYYLHTHDAAGIVHVEDPSTASRTTALHTLGQFFAIWGQPLSAWTTIYTSGQSYRGQGSQFVSNSTYTKYTASPGSMPLYAHEVIWLESGSPAIGPSQLPGVQFTY